MQGTEHSELRPVRPDEQAQRVLLDPGVLVHQIYEIIVLLDRFPEAEIVRRAEAEVLRISEHFDFGKLGREVFARAVVRTVVHRQHVRPQR